MTCGSSLSSIRLEIPGRLVLLAVLFVMLVSSLASGQSIPIAASSDDTVGYGNAVATCVTSDGSAWYFVHSPLNGKVKVWRLSDANVWTAMPALSVDKGVTNGAGIYGFNKTIAADSNLLVVGEPGSGGIGAIRIFQYVGGSWTQQYSLAQSGTGYRGASVDVSGGIVVCGVPDAASLTGQVEIYRNTGSWGLIQTLSTRTAAGDEERFGTAVAIDGIRLAVGAPFYGDRVGRAYSFKFNGSQFVYEKTFGGGTTGDVSTTGPADVHFSWSIDVSKNRIVVGAPVSDLNGFSNRGAIWIYTGQDSVWTRYINQPGTTLANDQAGHSVAIQDNVVFVGAPYHKNGLESNGGAVYIYRDDGSGWAEDQTILLPTGSPSGGWTNKLYGYSIAYGRYGYLAVGAPGTSGRTGSGFVYEFAPRPTGVAASDGPSDSVTVTWTKRATLMTANIYRGLYPTYPLIKQEPNLNSTIDVG